MASIHELPDTQLTFGDIGEDLAKVVFVVVDLETTGGPATSAGITEIGAVKVLAGEVIGEFATLVRPEASIPPHITALTGIDNAMVLDAPSVAGAVCSFGEFAGDAVLVAHNAPYDLGFLKAACARYDLSWFPGRSLDTARLARVALLPGEVRNCKLATLAAHFRAPVTPNHRALADARATTHVLHCLMERVGSLGVRSWEDLRDFVGRVSTAQRTKRHLAQGLPNGPGVYTFVDKQGAPLYVGTSGNVRARVRNYFTAAENRARMCEMIAIADRVEAIPCATTLEARIREIRLISQRRPHYNRRSRQASTSWWLRLVMRPAPRLVASKSTDGVVPEGAWGPFPSRSAARGIAETLIRLTKERGILGDSGLDHRAATVINLVFDGDLRVVLTTAEERMRELAAMERFEDASSVRDSVIDLCAASSRHHRFRGLVDAEQVVAAEPDNRGGWAIHVIRSGRLVSAAHCPKGADARATAAAAIDTAEVTESRLTTTEETSALARWLETPGVRLVDVRSPLAWPIGSGSPMSLVSAADFDPYRHRSDRAGASRPVGPAPGTQRVSRILHVG